MTRSATCPKCSGQMEEGFVLDRTYGANLQASWVEGVPAPSFWTGVKMKAQEQLPVTTFRCSTCGYLEPFAAPT
jgi:hypothetical protein